MPVGDQASTATVDTALTTLTVGVRDLMAQIETIAMWVNQSGGAAFLETLGYDAADADTALQALASLSTLSAVYFGTAAVATPQSFHGKLAPFWAGR